MDKLRVGQPISAVKIKQSVCLFLQKMPSDPGSHSFKFKHSSHFSNSANSFDEMVSPITADHFFIRYCIQYCVAKQLGSSVREEELLDLKGTADKMRAFYFRMCTTHGWNKEYNFQINMVYVTKVVVEYYSEMFSNLKTNAKLQSQIFIILMYVLIGNRVGPGCFRNIEKKHLKKVESNQKENANNKKDSDSKVVDKQNVKDRASKRPTLVKKSPKFDRESFSGIGNSKGNSFSTLSKIRYMNEKEDKQSWEIENFKQLLKQSLHIDPLPKIKKIKASIQSLNQSNQADIHNFSNFASPSSKTSCQFYDKQKKHRSFFSTVVSSSLKSQISKRNVSIAEYNRPFKIKHRVPFESAHQVVFNQPSTSQNLQNKQVNKTAAKDKQQSFKMNSQQWKRTVRGIKEGNNMMLQKIQMSNEDRYLNLIKKSEQDEPVFNIDASFRRTLKNIEKEHMEKQLSLIQQKEEFGSQLMRKGEFRMSVGLMEDRKFGTRLDFGTKNYKEDESFLNTTNEKAQKNNIRASYLKQQQDVFNILSKERKMKIQYSMFMLPSMHTKLHF